MSPTVQVRALGDLRSGTVPLDGEQIAQRLEQAGLYSRAALDVLITAEVTADQMGVIAAVGGPAWDAQEGRMRSWDALAELVAAAGMDAAQVDAWRALGLSDCDIEGLYENLPFEVVADVMGIDPDLGGFLPVWVQATRRAGVPDEELPGWVAAGLIRTTAMSEETVVGAIARWRSRLGVRAVHYAAAGFTLVEACRVDADGWYDPDALAALAALRSASQAA